MSNEKVWVECQGRGSPLGKHSPIRFGVDRYQVPNLGAHKDPITECPVCDLRNDMEDTKRNVARETESLYTNFMAAKSILDKAGDAVHGYARSREEEISVFQETNKELLQMLEWWKATCKIEDSLMQPDPNEPTDNQPGDPR